MIIDHNKKASPFNTADFATVDSRENPGVSERNPFDLPTELFLYPNPTFGPINIELGYDILQINLINLNGQVLSNLAIQALEKDKVQIDLSKYAAGAYFLQIVHSGGTDVEKVILVRE